MPQPSMPMLDIISSFAGGEFSPSLYGRVDMQKYSSGLRTCRNFIVMPYGGVTNRTGTFYVAPAKGKCRVIPFEFNVTQAYVIELGNKYARFYMNDGQIQLNGAPYEITTPWSDTDLSLLKFTQSADTLFFVHPNYPPYTLTRSSHTNWVLTQFANTNGPFMTININKSITIQPSALTGSITLTASSGIFNSGHVGTFFKLTHYINGQDITGTFNAAGQTSGALSGTDMTWRLITNGTWAGQIYIEKSLDNGATWQMYRSYTNQSNTNYNQYATDSDNCMFRLRCVSLSSGTISYDLSADPMPVNGIAQITAVTDAQHVTATVQTAFGAISTTDEWYEGAWSPYRGWPSVVVFYQDRLVFAGTATQPQTTWMSNTSDYYNFGVNSTVKDTDTISVNLVSRQMNKINSLVALGDIVALTAASEWKIGPTQMYGAVTPSQIRQLVQGQRGSNSLVDPIVIGNRIIFVQRLGNVVRDLAYQFYYDMYTGDDCTMYSNHLVRGHTMQAMAYQQEPYSVVWFVREDGVLLSMTYQYEQQVTGWARHDTNGYFESVCTISGSGYTEVWFVVNRPWGRCIERMAPHSWSTDPSDMYYVDCGIQYNNPITITNITSTNPVTVTAPTHGFSNGQLVGFFQISWQGTDTSGNPNSFLNYGQYLVENATTNTFTINDPKTGNPVDGSSFTAYMPASNGNTGGFVYATAQTFTGLTYLNGQTVSILADGNVLPQQVVQNGSITLPVAASKVSIGLPYSSDMETLNIDFNAGNGTIQSQLVDITEATVRMENSRGGLIGLDENHLLQLNLRPPQPYGTPIALYTGDNKVPIPAGYDTNGRLFIRQSDPLPLTILAVIPKITVGGSN